MGANNIKLHVSKRGLDLPITGAPEQKIENAPAPKFVAVLAADYVGMRPRMEVQVGDSVKRGQVLFEDRKMPGVFHTSPGAGTVAAIHRGERRALLSVVIELDEGNGQNPQEVAYESLRGKDPASLSADEVRAGLIESGLWTALRARPFSRVPSVETAPQAIFVTAMDTNPLAPDVAVVLGERQGDFETGLTVLSKLANGRKVFLCKEAGSSVTAGAAAGVETHEFKGIHPAGTVGFHIHTIYPVNQSRVVWHVGYQDVAAIGYFFKHGKLNFERVVALAGPRVKSPRLIRTRLGAAIDPMVSGGLKQGENRVISGSVWNGRAAMGEVTGYLGRYANQITVIEEGNKRKFLGWLTPGFGMFSTLRLFGSTLTPGKKYDFNTDLNGGKRGLVPLGGYEKVMPFDLMPTFLLRSIISKDMEKAEELGVLELDEEDVALCTFVCPSKNEYGVALREMLTQIEKEG